ncbi:ABC transporter substrate-binding protein [Altererythrobacter salegens]|uniref:ABC transporter substrate-binding protein n=1 Tax=Croceibacterium salegens TaxID=1737568 RepID=A0A6I4SSH2_9SPHN|nr:penicillin-binding protein activator [Croceibacterium salegens]MXO58815.1 ABC transporter substrate-binding protein [Croceibacterium salegens]
MFGNWKRLLTVGLLSLALAGCKIIPGGGQPPVVTPGPSQGPEENVLPTDDGRHRVALLVPLSGSNGEAGQSIANATTMALLDTNASNLRITTYDTATGAGTAAAQAIRDGNKLILGPLLGTDVTAVLAQARPASVPLISFSNDTSVAAQDVFVMGVMPEQSITRTVDYAMGHGSKRFAAIVPNGEYGRRAEIALSGRISAMGGTLVATERYDRGNTSIISAAERLKARGGFDTVLIADGVRLSAMAAGALKDAGTALPRLVGTELWSGDDDLARAASLRGSWYSAVSDGRYRQFVTSYEARFGNKPYRIATLGYDSVLLTLRIARDWQPGRAFPTSQLLDDGGFLGIDGPFRFRRGGVAERAMEVRQVGNGSVSVVDPAPTRF